MHGLNRKGRLYKRPGIRRETVVDPVRASGRKTAACGLRDCAVARPHERAKNKQNTFRTGPKS